MKTLYKKQKVMTKNHVEIFIACFSLYTLFIFVIGIYEFVCLSNKTKNRIKTIHILYINTCLGYVYVIFMDHIGRKSFMYQTNRK